MVTNVFTRCFDAKKGNFSAPIYLRAPSSDRKTGNKFSLKRGNYIVQLHDVVLGKKHGSNKSQCLQFCS